MTKTSRACMLWLAIACAIGSSGCAKPTPRSALAPVSGAGMLRPSDQLGAPFVVEQRLRGHYGQRELSIDCVVQLAANKLTVVGLTPFGTRAFSIEQTGTEVRFQKFVDREIPFEPIEVLYDIHRVFFRGLEERTDGVHEGPDLGDLVRETRASGQLVERRFQSLEGPGSNLVVVTYEGAPAPVVAPLVKLTNVAYGYTLEIETIDQKLLEPGYTLQVERAAPAQ